MDKNEKTIMASIECSNKFIFAWYSNFTTRFGLELIHLGMELNLNIAALFWIAKISSSFGAGASLTISFLRTLSIVRASADRITQSEASMIAVSWPLL